MTAQPALMLRCTVPNLEWLQMTDEGIVGMQDVLKPSDSAPCCL